MHFRVIAVAATTLVLSHGPTLGMEGTVGVLPRGFLIELLTCHGIEVPKGGERRSLSCPVPDHEDTHPSAFVTEDNYFYCAVCCCSSGRWTAKKLAEAIGARWPVKKRDLPPVTNSQAERVWQRARERARCDGSIDRDRDVYDFLEARSISEAWEAGSFGIVADGPHLPEAMRSWPRRGYRVVAPLYDHQGQLVSLQARAVRHATPKTMNCSGLKIGGSMFATATGLALLRGQSDADTIIVGEGITDYLALSFLSPVPAFTAAGAGLAKRIAGAWVSGKRVVMALDCDLVGRSQTRRASDSFYAAGALEVAALEWSPGANDVCDELRFSGADALHDVLEEVTRG